MAEPDIKKSHSIRNKILGGILAALFFVLLFSFPFAIHGLWRYMGWSEDSKGRQTPLERYRSDPVRIANTENAIKEHRLFLGMRESDARKSVGAPHKEIKILEDENFLVIWVQTASVDSPVVIFRYGVIQEIQPSTRK